jgi:hypothetical protein
VKQIDEVATADGPIDPDNVMYSLNSTRDWYIDADVHGEWSRLNWRGLIGIDDWEFRFTEDSSEYYNFDTDLIWDHRAPFEVWNIGPGTADDPSDDVRVYFATLDDDESGGWSWGDRIYVVERPYVEPLPEEMEYTWDDDFHIGRIVFHDYSEAAASPALGTVVRFTTNKPNAVDDVFTFTTKKVGDVDGTTVAKTMDNIKTVPNPYYNYAPYYELNQFDRMIKFINLPPNVEITFRIFNLAGDLVRTFVQPAGEDAEAVWDVKTESGLYVASGIYIYLAESEIGQKVGKMAVFTEIEQLNVY